MNKSDKDDTHYTLVMQNETWGEAKKHLHQLAFQSVLNKLLAH